MRTVMIHRSHKSEATVIYAPLRRGEDWHVEKKKSPQTVLAKAICARLRSSETLLFTFSVTRTVH